MTEATSSITSALLGTAAVSGRHGGKLAGIPLKGIQIAIYSDSAECSSGDETRKSSASIKETTGGKALSFTIAPHCSFSR